MRDLFLRHGSHATTCVMSWLEPIASASPICLAAAWLTHQIFHAFKIRAFKRGSHSLRRDSEPLLYWLFMLVLLLLTLIVYAALVLGLLHRFGLL